MVSQRFQFAFIHIPKTGGTSIASQLYQYCEKITKHQFWQEMSDEITCRKDYFIFSIVRNPWEREVSRYMYQRQTPDNPMHTEAVRHSFPAWLKRRHADRDFLSFYGAPMLNWLIDEEGNVIPDFIARLESIYKDWNIILTGLTNHGIAAEPELPILNKSSHCHYSEYYNEESKEMVSEFYAKDISYFDYCFEDS